VTETQHCLFGSLCRISIQNACKMAFTESRFFTCERRVECGDIVLCQFLSDVDLIRSVLYTNFTAYIAYCQSV